MSKIEWTDETWNWLVGCSRTSPGCANCYAADAAKSARLQQFPQYQSVKDWDGTVQFVKSQLDKPLKRRKPTRYFTCSMSDVFHESVPFEWIDRAFAVMALCPQHTFQVLTKRPERMLEYLRNAKQRVRRAAVDLGRDRNLPHTEVFESCQFDWPLPNVWLGVTCENQEMADKRIPLLLQTPAAVRFLSCEPLLESIDLRHVQHDRLYEIDALTGKKNGRPLQYESQTTIDWIIVGGESGQKARPLHLAWARSLIQQCRDAGVPVFMKQLGSHYVTESGTVWRCGSRKYGELSDMPEDLRVREFPVCATGMEGDR